VLSLYLLRHGETEFSREDRFCGRIDAPLTDIGRQMAWWFAEMYGELDFQAVCTSTKQRAVSTAEPLATRLLLPIGRESGLDEIDYGEWQGRWKGEVASTDRRRYRKWRQNPGAGVPGGESLRAVQARAARVVRALRARHAGGRVLVVSHKTTLRALICGLLGIELALYRERIPQPVCALSVIELVRGGANLRMLADLSHLPPWLRARALGVGAAPREVTPPRGVTAAGGA
jgi:probable phosphoglycerate mutase